MIDLDMLWRQAKADLTIHTDTDQPDVLLWERAQRVVELSKRIANLLGPQASRLDLDVLIAAALYVHTGWAVQYREGSITRGQILTKPMTDLQRELSAATVQESLAKKVPAKRCEAICKLIRESGNRSTTDLAAQVLSEACQLDEIGPILVWHTIRRHFEEGRGLDDLVTTWNRQREYNFWPARINESFRIDVVRRIAYERLNSLDGFMNALAGHLSASDVVESECDAEHAPSKKRR